MSKAPALQEVDLSCPVGRFERPEAVTLERRTAAIATFDDAWHSLHHVSHITRLRKRKGW